MKKANGRLLPAAKEELANLKGKEMICPKCGETYVLKDASFASEVCQSCGTSLEDLSAKASKMNGRSRR